MSHNFKKLISLFISFCFIFEQAVFAQSIDLSHYFVQNPAQAIQSDKFRPLHLRYLGYDNLNNDFKILLDKGDTRKEDVDNKTYIEENTQTLLKYFFIGLSLPNDKFWVNLRPDAPDNIIDEDLAKTDIGKILLESDLNLKKDTSSLTSPQTPEGRVYWDKLYQKAEELYGTTNITIPTLTRPWIVPDEIILRESPDTSAYIYKATLKVMLEEDYLKSQSHKVTRSPDHQATKSPVNQTEYSFNDPRLKELNQYSTQLIKELIIPKLTQEINSSRRYAPLRQVYYSLILAQHFKKKLTNKSGPYSNLIDSRDLTNLISKEPWDKRTYFKDYQKSFQQGEYNLSGPVYTTYGQSIRKYMSGGVELGNSGSSALMIRTKNNRIIDHPEILKVSSAMLPGDLKTLDSPTSSPAVVYVSKREDLQISDNPEIKRIWDGMVEENLRLYEFAQELTRLSRMYGVINNFPEEELKNLRGFRELYDIPDNKNKNAQDTLVYNLGFITLNSGIKVGDDSLLPAQFKFNLLFLVSMVNAKIDPAELFNKENNNVSLIDKDDLNKIATGGKLREGEKFYDYTWKPFKRIKSIVWQGAGKKKSDDFFKKFESLFNLFQEERIAYHEITRLRYESEKPYIVILEQYREQLQGALVNSPRKYIEKQESIIEYPLERGTIGYAERNLGGLLLPGESVGKVRKFMLPNGQEVYAKRVNPLRTRYPEEEIAISLEAEESLKKISPYFGVQEFIGIIYDQGAFYLLSRAIVSEQPRPPETIRDLNRFKLDVVDSMVRLGMPKHDIQKEVVNKFGEITWVFLDFETFPYRLVKDAAKALEALKSRNNKEKANEKYRITNDSDSDELIFKVKPKAEILKKVIGSLQQKAKEIEEDGKVIEIENEEVNFFEKYTAFKETIDKKILNNPKSINDPGSIKEEITKFGELLDKFRVKVINIVKNDNEEKVFFLVAYVSIFYDLKDKLNKAMHYPHYIDYGSKVEDFIRVMDAYIKLLSDIQNPGKIKEGYVKKMDESRGEPKLTYWLLTEYNKLSQEEKSSALPEEIKEVEIEEILKTFSLNNPDWLGGGLKNKITEDYGGLSVLEPIITDQYGQWNDVSRLSDEMMNELKARLNKEEANEYFYLPIITKHWIKVLTSQYWVNSYNYKVIIAKKSALEKSLNYTYRDIVEGDDDVLLLWEFTVRSENNPPTIILEPQGLYKGLRRQGFISEAYPLFVQRLAEKFPGWQVEGEFENPEKHENPPALVLFKNYFLDPQPLDARKDEVPDYTKPAIWKARIPPFNPSSSPVNNPGGIDLRALPITIQSALNQSLTANMPIAGSALNLNLNLDKELQDIQNMLKAGIMPSSERIKEYALASSSLNPGDYSREIDKILGCIADIFRLEEEKAKPTPQILKDMLIQLESDKST